MVFNDTSNTILVISCTVVIFWWKKPEYPEKRPELPQVTDKLYLVMLYRVHLVNYQKKEDTRTNYDLQNITQKTKD